MNKLYGMIGCLHALDKVSSIQSSRCGSQFFHRNPSNRQGSHLIRESSGIHWWPEWWSVLVLLNELRLITVFADGKLRGICHIPIDHVCFYPYGHMEECSPERLPFLHLIVIIIKGPGKLIWSWKGKGCILHRRKYIHTTVLPSYPKLFPVL